MLLPVCPSTRTGDRGHPVRAVFGCWPDCCAAPFTGVAKIGAVGLQDVTRDAILDAVDEYEDLGRDGFLSKYGFAAQVDVVLEYVGQKYDGVAVIAAGHGFATGTPLGSGELVNRENEVAERLAKLQFRVLCTPKAAKAPSRPRSSGGSTRRTSTRSTTGSVRAAAPAVARGGQKMPVPDWTLQPGDVVDRKKLALVHGDPMTRHIEPTGRTPNVLVFADPHKTTHGHDGWAADRSAYFVTGEGRRGDQSWTHGNDALRNHADQGRAVRLFEVEQTWRPGGKNHCYLGEFVLCPEDPYRMDVAPDSDGAERQVIVFKLVSKDASATSEPETPAEQVIDLDPATADIRDHQGSDATP